MNLMCTKAGFSGAVVVGLLWSLSSSAFANTCTDSLTLSLGGRSQPISDPTLNSLPASDKADLQICAAYAFIRTQGLGGTSLAAAVYGPATDAIAGKIVSETVSGTITYDTTTYRVSGTIEFEAFYNPVGADYWIQVQNNSTYSVGGTQYLSAEAAVPTSTSLTPFTLSAGQCRSASGMNLCMQTDGNLVLYNSNYSKAVWATSFFPTYDWTGFSGPTYGQSCAGCMAAFQSDGNLVLYRGTYVSPYWASRSDPFSGAHLIITQSTLMIVNSAGEQIWN